MLKREELHTLPDEELQSLLVEKLSQRSALDTELQFISDEQVFRRKALKRGDHITVEVVHMGDAGKMQIHRYRGKVVDFEGDTPVIICIDASGKTGKRRLRVTAKMKYTKIPGPEEWHESDRKTAR